MLRVHCEVPSCVETSKHIICGILNWSTFKKVLSIKNQIKSIFDEVIRLKHKKMIMCYGSLWFNS